MNGVTQLCVSLVAVVVSVVNCAYGAERQGRLVMEKVKVHTMAKELTEIFGQAVCFEDQRSSGEKEPLSPGTGIRDIRVSLNEDKTTLTGALTRALENIPAIRWEIDLTTGIANIYPATNSWCDWTLPSIEIKDKTFKEILIEEDVFGLRARAIKFFVGRGNHSWLNRKVSLRIEGGTRLRKALNLLCSLFPPGVRWEITTEQGADGHEYGLLRMLYFESAQDAQTKKRLNLKWREWKEGSQPVQGGD